MISYQVCWQTMRWHNGQIRRSLNPHPSQVFQDCSSKWEESVAHSILARSLSTPIKAVYMSADHDHQISMDFCFALMFSMFSTKHFGQKPTWKYLCPQGNVGMIVDLTLIPSPSPDGITSHGTP